MNVKELRAKSETELKQELQELLKTHFKLRMQNPGQVIAKSTMLDRISEDTPDCTESSLKTHVSHLRSKLREASGRDVDYVEAVWGIGFRLNV